ncbi:MAG: hypothetical protein ACYDH6_23450 [Acidimicrobiales bacterium]
MWAEGRATVDVALHDLAEDCRLAKAEREIAANRRLAETMIVSECALYDRCLPMADSSVVKQRLLADRLTVLTLMDNDVAERFRR